MKLSIWAGLAVMAAVLAGCITIGNSPAVHGSGNIVTQKRQLSGFHEVSVSGAGSIILTQGDEESLEIETDDNLIPFIRSEIRNGSLSIGPRNVDLHSTRKILYRLNLRNLNALHLSGAVNASAGELQTDQLVLRISGAGKIDAARLDARSLKTDISGAGNVSVAGQTEEQVIHISGAGNFHAPEFKSARSDVHVSGSGDASLWVTETLTVNISGSGHVEYRGYPSVSYHISGSGRLRHAGAR